MKVARVDSNVERNMEDIMPVSKIFVEKLFQQNNRHDRFSSNFTALCFWFFGGNFGDKRSVLYYPVYYWVTLMHSPVHKKLKGLC